MRSFTLLALGSLLAGLAVSADLSSINRPSASNVRGEYMEARSADVYTGACFANAEVELTGNLAVMGWKIETGSWQGVKLDGLGVMAVVKAESTLGDAMHASNPAKAVLIVDQKATEQQRAALTQFARRMGGKMLSDVVRVESRPIELTTQNIHSRSALMVAGELAKIETRALEGTDQICRHEQVWYQPLTPLEHAMPAYTLEHSYQGKGLGTLWSVPQQRSAFVGTFNFTTE